MNLPKAIALLLLATSAASIVAQTRTLAPQYWDLMTWEARSFLGMTDYAMVTLDSETVLQADADASASALYREQSFDLNETPYLQWRWRTDSPFGANIDETRKSGDDYVARLYVVRSGGFAFWRTKALNYVWASNQSTGSRWDNPFAGDNVQMLAVDSGSTHLGQWRHHVRDVKADWLAAFGESIDSLDGIAIMTDTDNSGAQARSWYADIGFSQQK
ncbi:MAG: DUF3047 domain-containing protein [Gammaproteobacteria bacterium]